MPDKITPAFRDTYEPCLESFCQAETLACFADVACIATLKVMASQTTGGGFRSRRQFNNGFFNDDFFSDDLFSNDFLDGDFGGMHICMHGIACSNTLTQGLWSDIQTVNGEDFCCNQGSVNVDTRSVLGMSTTECTCLAGSANSNYNDDGADDEGYAANNNNNNNNGENSPPTAIPTVPSLTAYQQWAIGMNALLDAFEGTSTDHALITCMVASKCGLPSKSVGGMPSTTTSMPLGSIEDLPETRSIWTWLWFIILIIIALIVLLIVCCIKKRRDRDSILGSKGGATTFQNAAYEETSVAISGVQPLEPDDQDKCTADGPAPAAVASVGAFTPVDEFEC